MSDSGRWRMRVLPSAREWFGAYVRRASPARRRALRAAFDGLLFRLARHPRIGGVCNARYDTLDALPDTHHFVFVDALTVFYVVDEDARTLTIVRVQASTMEIPSAESLRVR